MTHNFIHEKHKRVPSGVSTLVGIFLVAESYIGVCRVLRNCDLELGEIIGNLPETKYRNFD